MSNMMSRLSPGEYAALMTVLVGLVLAIIFFAVLSARQLCWTDCYMATKMAPMERRIDDLSTRMAEISDHE